MSPPRIALLLVALGALVGLAWSPRTALAHLELVETTPAGGAAPEGRLSLGRRQRRSP